MTEDEMYDIIRCYEDSERDYHELNIELENENAKLRELAKMLYRCAYGMLREFAPSWVDRSEGGCGMDCTDNGEGCCMELLERRMRELGIEVDE